MNACLLTALAALGAGCGLGRPTPVAHVRLSPSVATPPHVLLALPPTCNSSEGDCTDQVRAAIATSSRMSVEFAGYTLIDAERVNAELRQRRVLRSASDAAESSQVEVTGALFVDATPAEQRAILDSMAIDGLLEIKVAFGSKQGFAQEQQIRVGIELARVEPAEVVWSSSCTAVGGDALSPAQAIDLATRCALEGALLR